MTNSRTLVELKNCKLENSSLLFEPLAQCLGSDKRRVLSTCITYTQTFLFLKTYHFVKCFHLIFLYIIRYNKVSWRPHEHPSQSLGSRPQNPPKIDAFGWREGRTDAGTDERWKRGHVKKKRSCNWNTPPKTEASRCLQCKTRSTISILLLSSSLTNTWDDI